MRRLCHAVEECFETESPHICFLRTLDPVFHVYRRYGLPVQIPILSEFLSYGNMAVDIFLFFSGCCLYLSYDKKHGNLKEYYVRRISRILIPYLLISIPYWIWRTIANGNGAASFFANVSSATFWISGRQTTWFVFAIMLCYLIFPLLYGVVKKSLKLTLCVLVFIYLCNVVCYCFSISLYANSSILWTRLPIFLLGCMAGRYADVIDVFFSDAKREYLTLAFAIVVLVLVMFVVPVNIYLPSEIMWMLFAPMTILLVAVLICAAGRSMGGGEAPHHIVNSLGECTLELYLVQIPILNILDFYGLNSFLEFWSYLLVPAASLLIAVPMSALSCCLRNKLVKSYERIL